MQMSELQTSNNGHFVLKKIMLWRISIEIDGNLYISLRITGFLDFIHRPEF
jgi:hypothetical protein